MFLKLKINTKLKKLQQKKKDKRIILMRESLL